MPPLGISEQTLLDLVRSNMLLAQQIEQMLKCVDKHEKTLYGDDGESGIAADAREWRAFKNGLSKIAYALAIAALIAVGVAVVKLLFFSQTLP